MRLRAQKMVWTIGAVAAVGCFVGVISAKAVTRVQFQFDPRVLVESEIEAGGANAILDRTSLDNPRRLHVGSGIGENSRAYFQNFWGDTNPSVQPNWYGISAYQDNGADPGSSAPAGSVTPVATNPFGEVWNSRRDDDTGRIVLNYFNLFIPETSGMPAAGDPLYQWVSSPISKTNGSLVNGATGANSNWGFFDSGLGATGPMFFVGTGALNDSANPDGLFANSPQDFGQFTFDFYTSDPVVDGQEFTFWFGTNSEDYYNMLYNGENSPIWIDGLPVPGFGVSEIRGYEGSVKLTATVIPEPSTVAMSILGGILLGIGAIRRRKIRVNAKALSLLVVAGALVVVSSAQAAGTKVVRSGEPAAVVGLKGTIEIFDAQGDVQKVYSLATAPRIQPPALVHVPRGSAMLRVGEMYVQVPEGGWVNLVKNAQGRSIELVVPSFSEVPASVYVEAQQFTLTKGSVVRASYDFVKEQVEVSTSRISGDVEMSRAALAELPGVENSNSSTINFSAAKGAGPAGGTWAGPFIPPVSPFQPPVMVPHK